MQSIAVVDKPNFESETAPKSRGIALEKRASISFEIIKKGHLFGWPFQ